MFHRARVSGYSPIQTPTNEGPPVDSRDLLQVCFDNGPLRRSKESNPHCSSSQPCVKELNLRLCHCSIFGARILTLGQECERLPLSFYSFQQKYIALFLVQRSS